MGKGILAVGFPDSQCIQHELLMSLCVEDDKTKLRKLIYSCSKGVTFSKKVKTPLNRVESIPDSPVHVSQIYLQSEQQSSWYYKSTSELNLEHPQTGRAKIDSHTSQTESDGPAPLQKNSQHMQTDENRLCHCSIL